MLVAFVVILVVLFGALCAGLYFNQNSMVFVPSREMVMTPDEVNMRYEDIYIEVAPGENINAWYIPANDSSAPTVLFCHGNTGNISHRIYSAQFLNGLGANLLLFDCRGYGMSDGAPSEENAYADAAAAYNWLVNEKGINPSNLFIFGRSLGGALVVELALHVECAGVIVESSFTSAHDMGQRMFPYLPTKLLSRYRFDSISKVGRLSCPILVTHSPDDDLIPYEMGRSLYNRAAEPKTFIDLSGRHNERLYFDSDVYINGLRGFLGFGAGISEQGIRDWH